MSQQKETDVNKYSVELILSSIYGSIMGADTEKITDVRVASTEVKGSYLKVTLEITESKG